MHVSSFPVETPTFAVRELVIPRLEARCKLSQADVNRVSMSSGEEQVIRLVKAVDAYRNPSEMSQVSQPTGSGIGGAFQETAKGQSHDSSRAELEEKRGER